MALFDFFFHPNKKTDTDKLEKGGQPKMRTQTEYAELVNEKEKLVKNLTAQQVADMWNAEVTNPNGKMTKAEAEKSSAKKYLVNLLVEKSLSPEEYAAYFKNGGELTTSHIPILKPDATWEQVKAYLEWLWASPYQYHIDDDAHDFGFANDVADVLESNNKIVWKHAYDKMGSNIWDAYYKEDKHNPNQHFENGGSPIAELIKNAKKKGANGFLKQKGEVLDFDNGSYLSETEEFVKLANGKIAYTPIQTYKGYEIKFNKNGVYYFTIFKNGKSLEDGIYSIFDAKQIIDEMAVKFAKGGQASESGLKVTPYTAADFAKLADWLKTSDYYAEENTEHGYFLFPEDKDTYEALEAELYEQFDELGIDVRIEGVFGDNEFTTGGSPSTNKTWIVNLLLPYTGKVNHKTKEIVLGRLSDEADVKQAIERKKAGGDQDFIQGKVLSVVLKNKQFATGGQPQSFKDQIIENLSETETSDFVVNDEMVEFIEGIKLPKKVNTLEKAKNYIIGKLSEYEDNDFMVNDELIEFIESIGEVKAESKSVVIEEIGNLYHIVNEAGQTDIAGIEGFKTQRQAETWAKENGYEVVESFFADGGHIGFKALANKVAKQYRGKKVSKEYQSEYGKRYSAAEAAEVGRKVAAKVYREQQGKEFATGGAIPKTYSIIPFKDRAGTPEMVEAYFTWAKRIEGSEAEAIEAAKELFDSSSEIVQVEISRRGKTPMQSKKIARISSDGVVSKLEDGGSLKNAKQTILEMGGDDEWGFNFVNNLAASRYRWWNKEEVKNIDELVAALEEHGAKQGNPNNYLDDFVEYYVTDTEMKDGGVISSKSAEIKAKMYKAFEQYLHKELSDDELIAKLQKILGNRKWFRYFRNDTGANDVESVKRSLSQSQNRAYEKENMQIALEERTMRIYDFKGDEILEDGGFIKQLSIADSSNLYEEGGSLTEADRYNYMLLDRLRSDCDYFLGNEGKSRHVKRLWAGSVDGQIAEMKKLWKAVPQKPEWLSMEDILEYERKMKADAYAKGGILNLVGKTFEIGNRGVVKAVRDFYTQKLLNEVEVNGVKYTRNKVYGHYNSPTNELLYKQDIEQPQMATGGEITERFPNNYLNPDVEVNWDEYDVNKKLQKWHYSPEQVWNKWNVHQRGHFLDDHFGKEITPMGQVNLSRKAFKFLPANVKAAIETHISQGQYAKGGSVSIASLQKEMDDHKAYCMELYPNGKMAIENGLYGVLWNGKLKHTKYIGNDYFEIDGTIYKDNPKSNISTATKLKLVDGGSVSVKRYVLYGSNGEYYIKDTEAGHLVPSGWLNHHIGKSNQFKSKILAAVALEHLLEVLKNMDKKANGGTLIGTLGAELPNNGIDAFHAHSVNISPNETAFEKGGGVSNESIEDRINRINSSYEGVTASKTYSSNRIQVISPYFNTLSEIKKKEFNGSGLMERYGNTSQYILYSNNIFGDGGGIDGDYTPDEKEALAEVILEKSEGEMSKNTAREWAWGWLKQEYGNDYDAAADEALKAYYEDKAERFANPTLQKVVAAIEAGKLKILRGGEKMFGKLKLNITELVWARNYEDGFKIEVFEDGKHIGTINYTASTNYKPVIRDAFEKGGQVPMGEHYNDAEQNTIRAKIHGYAKEPISFQRASSLAVKHKDCKCHHSNNYDAAAKHILTEEGIEHHDKMQYGGKVSDKATQIAEAIFYSNEKKGKIRTNFLDKTLEGLTDLITNGEYKPEEIASALFHANQKKGYIETGWGRKTLDGLTAMIEIAQNGE